ncbi:hypothetical protein B0F90DRAFT_880969 [Multifurca ochricompacta]|uniref:Uncharacterized protein n=1 Tax=Multifurca ochricompacta TaxID=376703 RepID=A0AAD4QLX9_9AGAM|nr:hypothetical protein B0F90DRAFT_880969 [Multifurca ochricompacta]
MPTQSPSQGTRNRANRHPQEGGSSNKPFDARRVAQSERRGAVDKAGTSALSGWGDGLVSLSFSSRLKQLHQKKMTNKGRPEDRPQRQQSKEAQHSQMQGRQRGQKEERGARSRAHGRDVEEKKSTTTTAQGNRGAVFETKAKMTRPSVSNFKAHARSTPTSAAAARPKTAPNKTKDAAPVKTPKAALTRPAAASASADRIARLAALSSTTNLNALFRTRDKTNAPITGPMQVSTTARVRSVLERSAGDYSRFLPRYVGMRKSASRPPALRTARHALASQRDVSLDQRRVALHIIGGLAQPRHQVRA